MFQIQVKILFIRNLAPSTTETDLREIFEELAHIDPNSNRSLCDDSPLGSSVVERVKKTKDYAFVHFTDRSAAERALIAAKLEGFNIHGSPIEISWSKPVDKNIYNQRKTLTKILSQGTPGVGMAVPSAGGPAGYGGFMMGGGSGIAAGGHPHPSRMPMLGGPGHHSLPL